MKPQVKHCIELARLQNVSKAAKWLGITQPQLSKSLQSLEQEVGFQIFERTNRGLIITTKGRQFLNHIEELERFWAQKNDYDETAASLFRIASHQLIAAAVLPRLVQQVRQDFPLLAIQYFERSSKDISHLVANREIELGIAADPSRLQGLILHEISRDDVAIFAAGPNDELLVVNPQMVQFSRLIKRSKYKEILEIENYMIAAQIAGKLGCHCLLPEPAAQQNKNFKKIKTLETISVKVVYTENNRSNPIVGRIRDIFKRPVG